MNDERHITISLDDARFIAGLFDKVEIGARLTAIVQRFKAETTETGCYECPRCMCDAPSDPYVIETMLSGGTWMPIAHGSTPDLAWSRVPEGHGDVRLVVRR